MVRAGFQIMAGHSPDTQPSTSGAASGPRLDAVSVQIDDPGGRLASPTLRGLRSDAARAVAVARPLHAVASQPEGEVRVRIVGDREMADAHVKYSNMPGTTDVLTFDLAEGGAAQGQPLDVDILVCIEEAARQAAARGHTVERELLLYILHGVLHCLGHDDHDEGAYQVMHAEEDRILGLIGVGPVFSAADARPDLAEGAR